MKLPILDLSGQYKQIRPDLLPALEETMLRGDFILGRELAAFEQEFARYCERKFCVGVNSGTDALFLALKSLDIGPGDEVIVPAFTYIATALAVTYTGARPVFVDVDEKTYNIDPAGIEKSIGRKTKAIIPVHLYGQPADMEPILKIAKKYMLKVIEDAAQAHGAKYKMPSGRWKMAGSISDIGCFSFYPTKNLGAYGDGGAIVTDSEYLRKKLLMLRDYGRKSRYKHIALGYNSRLDTLQAVILRIKLKYLDKWNRLRRERAGIYKRRLKHVAAIILPKEADYARHVYHQYVLRVKNRDKLVKTLAKRGIATLIHYPIPLPLQPIYKKLGYRSGGYPVAEKIAREVISLPIYPHLKRAQVDFISDNLKMAAGGQVILEKERRNKK